MDVGMIIGEATPLSWNRWKHLVHLAERLGYHSLFRSDHYFNGKQKEAIDVYLSFVMAATESERVRFGPLVTPVTFREPVNVGRMAQQLDALSDGRFIMGLGIGWYALEHEIYGLDFPPTPERYDRLEEAIEMMKELWYSESATYEGQYYRIKDANSQPHPPAGRPEILIGGKGPKRTMRICAEHGHEWNSTPLDLDEYKKVSDALAGHCETIGRDPSEIRRSMLLFATIGPDKNQEDMALQRFLDMMAPEGSGISLQDAIDAGHGPWMGSVEQLVDHVGQLRDLGLQEIVFEHFCTEDDTIPEWIATEVKPKLEAL